MATFIMNEKRDFILNIEKRHSVNVLIIANPYMQMPQYNITRVKEDNVGKNKKPSYTLIQQPELELARSGTDNARRDEPAVKSFSSSMSSTKKPETGFIKRLWNSLFGNIPDTATPSGPKKPAASPTSHTRPHTGAKGPERRPQHPNQANRRRRPAGSGATAGNQASPRQQGASTQSGNPQRKRNPNQQQSTNRATTAPKAVDAAKKKEPAVNRDSES